MYNSAERQKNKKERVFSPKVSFISDQELCQQNMIFNLVFVSDQK